MSWQEDLGKFPNCLNGILNDILEPKKESREVWYTKSKVGIPNLKEMFFIKELLSKKIFLVILKERKRYFIFNLAC